MIRNENTVKRRFLKRGCLWCLIIIGSFPVGCAAGDENSSTNLDENEQVIHSETTLSTEETIELDISEESTSKEADSTKKSDNQETETTYDGTEQETDKVLEDAKYYYFFYATMFFGEETSITYDETEFLKAYKIIRRETLKDYFSEIYWLSRDVGISLSLTPTSKLFSSENDSVYLWMARCIHAFYLLEEEYGEDENWDNPDSLKPQFHCHSIYAGSRKVPWNIEPYRTETDFLTIILYQANP